MSLRVRTLVFILVTSLTATACGGGGGGGGGGNNPNPPPSDSQKDTTPNSFSFNDKSNVAQGKDIDSNSITVTGINAPTSISVSGGYYSINGQGFTSASSQVENNDQVIVRLTSSTQPSTKTSATLTIGGVSAIFSVTTSTDIDPPQISMVFPPESGMHAIDGAIIRGISSSHDITSLTINGSPAQTTDNYSNWTGYVDLKQGENIFTIVAEDAAGNTTSMQTTLVGLPVNADDIFVETVGYSPVTGKLYFREGNTGESILTIDPDVGTVVPLGQMSGDPRLVVFDETANRLVGIGINGVYQVDINTGEDTLLFSDSGVSLQAAGASDITLDSDSQTLYVFHYNDYRIISIDLNSGARKLVTSNSSIFGNELAGHVDIDFDNGRLIATSGDNFDQLLNINLTTGQRELISDSLLVSPYTYNKLRGLVVDGDYAYVADVHGYLLRVDVRDGSFSVISDVSNEKEEHLVTYYEPTLEIDRDNGRVFVFGNTVFSIDLSTGLRSRIEKPVVGAGPSFAGFSVTHPSVTSGSVYALANLTEEAAVMSINRASGDRISVSNTKMGSGDPLTRSAGDIAIDEVSGAAYIAELSRIVRVDLSSGDRTEISSNTKGSGDTFSAITAIEYDAGSSNLYVNSAQNDKVFKVDPATGDRTEIYGPSTGSGPFLEGNLDIDINPADNSQLYLVDHGEAALLVIDLTDNSRQIVSSPTKGSGPILDYINRDLEITEDGKFAVISGYYDATGENVHMYINLETGDRYLSSDSLDSVPVSDSALFGKEYRYTTRYGRLNLEDLRTRASLIISK